MISRLPAVAGIVLAFIVFFAYVSPTYNGSIKDLRGRIEKQESALDAAKSFEERQNQLSAEMAAIPPTNLERLETLLPDSVDNIKVIVDLTALTSKTGVQLASIDAPPPVKSVTPGDGEILGKLPLKLSVVGSYDAFQTFLGSIEHASRLLDVSSISVLGSDTGVYTYDLSIDLYWLR